MDWNERVWQGSVEFFGEFMEPLVGGLVFRVALFAEGLSG